MTSSEYLLIKLGNIGKVNFYKEHNDVIEKYGFVDFARSGKRKVSFNRLKASFFFLKESERIGGKIIKAYFTTECIAAGERRSPSYYEKMDLQDATWVRINRMEIIEKEVFLKTYSLLNGKDIKALEKGAVPFFYVKIKK